MILLVFQFSILGFVLDFHCPHHHELNEINMRSIFYIGCPIIPLGICITIFRCIIFTCLKQ
ncbi:hypothetical protein BpHYR1_001704 [Brachionus plicatilis]|uniref:Uncharacterized protein n=1 Tax=Brachionus plicatilis TaxID=10195 RepID=A0A3M7SZX5_BRAPC|nr:hypothetical protein BpHYR1_001704 [Brachionus plicatilis]